MRISACRCPRAFCVFGIRAVRGGTTQVLPSTSTVPRSQDPPRKLGTGGPLKLGFSLSGVILLLGTASPLPVRVFVLSILTRFRLLPQCLSRNEESCSTASPPDARTVRASPDSDECSAVSPQLGIATHIVVVISLLPEVFGIADQFPRYTLLKRLHRFGQSLSLGSLSKKCTCSGMTTYP